MENDKKVVEETSVEKNKSECIKSDTLEKNSVKPADTEDRNYIADAEDKGDNIVHCTEIENLEIGLDSLTVDDIVEWDDPDLLLALQSLTTKDEGDEKNNEERVVDEDEDDGISKDDLIPTIDIDPVELQNTDLDTSFLNMFDFDDADVKNLASIIPERNVTEPALLTCQPCSTSTSQNTNRFVQDAKQKESIRRRQQNQENLRQQYLRQLEQKQNERNRANISNPFLLNSFKKNERTCYGHKETIFGLAFSPSGKFIATASQDSTIGIWDTEKNSRVATLHADDKNYECLRVAWISETKLASAGADGKAKIWEHNEDLPSGKWKCVHTLNHCEPKDSRHNHIEGDEEIEKNVPQIYALQYIEKWHLSSSFAKENLLMTSSDDYIHLWHMESKSIEKLMDINFTELDHGFGGVFIHFLSTHSDDFDHSDTNYENSALEFPTVTYNKKAYGGHRNPDNLVYVFEASYCATNKLLGVALSDGTLRLVNGRGVCVSILQLPGCESHLTSFAWDKSGKRLASCVATGHLILWEIETHHNEVLPSCIAVMEGGHTRGRPIFGAKYCGDKEEFILTWGVDGSVCLWDAHSEDQINEPLRKLVSFSDYAIYALDISSMNSSPQESKIDKKDLLYSIAVAGGREKGFLGIPFYIYEIFKINSND